MQENTLPSQEENITAIQLICDEFVGMPNARNLAMHNYIIGQTKALEEEIERLNNIINNVNKYVVELEESNAKLIEALETIKTSGDSDSKIIAIRVLASTNKGGGE